VSSMIWINRDLRTGHAATQTSGSLQDIAYPSGQHSPTLIRDTA